MPISGGPAPIPTGNGIPGAQGPGGVGSAGKVDGGQPAGVPFGQKMDGAHAAHDASKAPATSNVQFKDGTNPLDQARGIREEIATIRADLEKQQKAGKFDQCDGQLQCWRLLDLQTRAQDVHFRVELVTKVVEHGTSSVKQISQTQA